MNEKQEKLKFYADTPLGQKNKLFTFRISDYQHAIDLAAKFVQQKHFTIRAAWYINQVGKSIRFDNQTDLSKWENSIEEEKHRTQLFNRIYKKY